MSIINKFTALSPTKKTTFSYIFATIIQRGMAFITVPIYTRLMSEEQFGLVNIYRSWSGIFGVFVVLAASGVAFVGLNKYENDRPRFVSVLQGLMTTLTVLWFVVYLFLKGCIENFIGLPFILMCVMFIEILLSNIIYVWVWNKRYENQYKQLFVLTVGFALAAPIVSVFAVVLAPENLRAFAQIISIAIVQIVIYGFLYISIFIKGKKFFCASYWKYILVFSIPLIPHQLSQIVLNSSDRIMIEKMIGIEETAWYSVAYSGAMLLSVFAVAYTHSVIPWYYERIKNGDYDRLRRLSNLSSAVFAILPIIIALFAPEVVRFLAPENYYNAVWGIPPVAASVFFIFLYQFFVVVEYYFEKTVLIGAASVFCAVLNIAMNLIFLPMFGFVAAAYTTLATYVLFSLAHYINAKRLCKQNLDNAKLYNIKALLVLSIAVISASIGVTFTFTMPILRYSLLSAIFLLAILKRKYLIKKFKETVKI